MPDEIQKLDRLARDTDNAALATIATNLSYTRRDLLDIKQKLEGNYATKEHVAGITDEFGRRIKNLETIVYGAVGLVLVAFFGTLIFLATGWRH